MKITFVLPFDGRNPVGGFRVVYQYANHLAARGHDLKIVHPAGLYLDVGKNDWLLRNLFKYLWFALAKRYAPKQWFDLDSRVRCLWVPSLKYWFIPKADVIVATAWETAEWVATYPENRGYKYYLLQALEDWAADRERVLRTWSLPLKKIVIARWLEDMAHDMGESVRYIPNGLDSVTFGLDASPESRNPRSVLMLHHELSLKGSKDGIAALALVKQSFPDLEVTLFGIKKPQADQLPSWMRFVENPSRQALRKLYNEAAIFVAPSWGEGWGLTASEAMQCGCAVAMTAVNGHTEFGVDGFNTLMSPAKHPELLAQTIISLVLNQELRLVIAKNAVESMSQYTWNRAADAIEAYFQESMQ